MAFGRLEDASEASVRSALSLAAPALADLPLRMNPLLIAANPLWWSSSAVIDDSYVVKFAWSEVRAARLWREGMILKRLRAAAPSLAIPDVVVLGAEPVLLVTRIVAGGPLDGEWVWGAAERAMAWNVLTILGDALWRTEAGVALPGGGTVAGWVDDLERRLAALRLGSGSARSERS